MTTIQAIIIAIVEGLTEFLPVSSTGHMIITENLLGMDLSEANPESEFIKAFTVIIQFGAILSVVCLYWKRFFVLNNEPMEGGDSAPAWKKLIHKFDFYWKLLIAFLPAANDYYSSYNNSYCGGTYRVSSSIVYRTHDYHRKLAWYGFE